MSGNKNWYPVKDGRTPGIYTNWESAKAQTDGYSGNQHCKTPSLADAGKFMDTGYTKPGYTPPNPNGNSGAARGQPDYRAQGPSSHK